MVVGVSSVSVVVLVVAQVLWICMVIKFPGTEARLSVISLGSITGVVILTPPLFLFYFIRSFFD